MRSKLNRWVGLALLLTMLGAGASLDAQEEVLASLDPAQGLIQHRAVGAEEDAWQTVVERRLVGEGDWIRTDNFGLAYLTFFGGVEIEILPNSIVVVSGLMAEGEESFGVTMDVLLGDTLHRVERALDAASRYEIHTPSASIVVRGTIFRVGVSREGSTQVSALDGLVTVSGIAPDGTTVAETELTPGFSVMVLPDGGIEPMPEFGGWPEYPPGAPLAPGSCGNGECEPHEREGNLCPVDCLEWPGCGDGECDRDAGEDVITCPDDCGPHPLFRDEPGPDQPPRDEPGPDESPPGDEPGPDDLPPGDETGAGSTIFFAWHLGQCEIEPAARTVSNPVQIYWGVGCFDSQAHAAAHPHPADYQLYVDGQAWNMGNLVQSGPDVHSPICPWGWSFSMESVMLPPGEHTLRLVETVTDTWSGESGGRTAGDVETLTCQVMVAP